MEKFKVLGLSDNVLDALAKKGWDTPSEIQEKTIPLLVKGDRDIVGQAATGTGKTGAFGLPLIEQLDDSSKAVQAIVLCPTRELAVQVAEEIMSFKGSKKLFVQAIYGGQSYNTQIAALRKGVQIVVGTPGRVRDHIEKGTLKLNNVTHVVLDEADEMLNMGFEEEVREILKSVPEERRMLLFSATMPAQILKLAKTFMKEYDIVEVAKKEESKANIDQSFFEVQNSDRFVTLCRVIDTEPEFYGIVFCRTKMETDEIASKLLEMGYDAEAIHGDITQSQRELILKKFKMRKLNILVATDVAARGIDVNDLTHVINYNLPQDPESYVHRIGRTGRAGKHGTAITIVTSREKRDIAVLERITKSTIRRETVPSIADVVGTKTMKLKTEMQSMIEKGEHEVYLDLAKELLEDSESPEQVIAAIMKYALKDTLAESSYKEIGQTNSTGFTHDGKSRLFVARGHKDHMNAEQIAQFLADKAGIDARSIEDIRVFDMFTFITTPPAVAEQILGHFAAGRGKPLVTRAKEKPTGGFGGGGSSFGGGRNFERKERGDFGGKPRSGGNFHKDGFKKRDDDRSERPQRREFNGGEGRPERPARREFNGGDSRPERPVRREFAANDSRPERPVRKEAADKPYVAKQHEKGVSDFIPKKRANKMTDYLDNSENTQKPAATAAPKKEAKKDNFKIEFKDDDLNW
ncbi:MAG: DEAD/DEAH box helicase [Bacteroidetes bacterium]|nr:DEAD/DEAH box helicase [Bacteroidota bacterium]